MQDAASSLPSGRALNEQVPQIAGTAQSTSAPSGIEPLVAALNAAKQHMRASAEVSGYGFYRPENPNNFFPDHESCSAEEIANHKAACEAWDRGDYKAPLGSESFHDDSGKLVLHITRAPWGIGGYSEMDEEMEAHAQTLHRLSEVLPQLIELLQEATDDYVSHCEGGEADEWAQFARAAIAKATGEQA